MGPGDIVKTKSPGFGTGSVPYTGLVIEAHNFGPASSDIGAVMVMHEDGTIRNWYPWQLELVVVNARR